MKLSSCALFLAISAGTIAPHGVLGASVKFFYDRQEEWQNLDIEGTQNDCGKRPTRNSGNSPIDVPSSQCRSNLFGITMIPGTCGLNDLKFTMNDHVLKATYRDGCVKPTMMIPDKPFDLFVADQFHVHTGCEHKIDGKGCDAELHIVHLNPDGSEAAVLGFMIDNNAKEPHPMIDSLLGCWGETMDTFIATCKSELCSSSRERSLYVSDSGCPAEAFNVYDLVPPGSGYYYYSGGLTTPPCSEIVNWNLVDEKVSISLGQWSQIAWMITQYAGFIDENDECVMDTTVASATGSTSREVQDIGGREITHRCKVSTL